VREKQNRRTQVAQKKHTADSKTQARGDAESFTASKEREKHEKFPPLKGKSGGGGLKKRDCKMSQVAKSKMGTAGEKQNVGVNHDQEKRNRSP